MEFQQTVDVKKIWESLGTYHIYIPKESKEIVESYWNALFEGANGLYYNLAQYSLLFQMSNYIGHIVFSKQTFVLNTNQCDKLYLKAPTNLQGNSGYSGNSGVTYSYKVTSINNNGETTSSQPVIIYKGSPNLANTPNLLQWKAVDGAVGYKVYGRLPGSEKLIATVNTNTYIDNGSIQPTSIAPTANTAITDYLFLLPYENIIYISDIYCEYSKTTLIKNTDFTLVDGKYIKINNLNKITTTLETLFIDTFYILNPILVSFFIKQLYKNTDVMDFFNNYYNPHIVNFTVSDKSKHLSYLFNALFISLISGPTIGNLRKTLNYLYNIPFAYEDGVVIVSSDSSYKYITLNDITYRLPLNCVLTVNNGDTVHKFDILIEGVKIDDYISNMSLINGLRQQNNPYELYYILAIHVPNLLLNFGKYQPFIDFFKTSIVPPNLKIVEY